MPSPDLPVTVRTRPWLIFVSGGMQRAHSPGRILTQAVNVFHCWVELAHPRASAA